LLSDDHLPYPAAILQVFGVIQHRRRRHHRGRKRHPRLKSPPGLGVGVVKKVRDARGHLVKVTRHALFGRRKDIEQRIRQLGIGTQINTVHLERCNGTLRSQQSSRLGRRTRNGSRRTALLEGALWLWRDLYNWTRVHGALVGQSPAMALGLARQVWTVLSYVRHPVHVSDLQRDIWAEERTAAQESALDQYFHKKALPTS
jgi:transposase InsO family protein